MDAATHIQGDYVFLQGTRFVLRAVSKENTKTLMTVGKLRVASRQNKVFQYQFTRVNAVGRRIKWEASTLLKYRMSSARFPIRFYGTTTTMLAISPWMPIVTTTPTRSFPRP